MTLRSRLSAAWRAFRQDDFPPTTSVFLNLQPNTTYHVSAPKSAADYAEEMRAASRPSMADECEALRKEQEAELSRLTPDYSNLEVPAIIRKRKKLVSVPKE